MTFQRAKAISNEIVNFDWLALLIAGWVLPLRSSSVTYLKSLLFWAVPVVVLLPRFLLSTPTPSRRRRALAIGVGTVAGLGLVLDLILGSKVLKFQPMESGLYWGPAVPAIGGVVPIEEVFFYILGPAAMVLMYAWLDEGWMNRYNPQAYRENLAYGRPIVMFSPSVAIIGGALFIAGCATKAVLKPAQGWLPVYFTFLIVAAFLPAAALYRSVKELVNWRAFAVTTLFVIATSVMWEVTLAIPRGWWEYRLDGLMGAKVRPWIVDQNRFVPLEAVLVWFAAPFVSVLIYESVKTYQYLPSGTVRQKLLGK